LRKQPLDSSPSATTSIVERLTELPRTGLSKIEQAKLDAMNRPKRTIDATAGMLSSDAVENI